VQFSIFEAKLITSIHKSMDLLRETYEEPVPTKQSAIDVS